MSEITIPPEALEAAAIVLMSRLMVSQQDALHVWSGMYEPEKDQFRKEARASIAAALSAWPGAEYVYRQPHRLAVSYSSPAVILPLPQENTNDKT